MSTRQTIAPLPSAYCPSGLASASGDSSVPSRFLLLTGRLPLHEATGKRVLYGGPEVEQRMPVKPWFPTFIYESPLNKKGSQDYARALQAECLKVRDQDGEGQTWCQQNYPKGYTSYGTVRMLHRTSAPFIDLEAKIWPHIKRFAGHIDMELQEANLAMLDCWVNIMSEGSTHGFHDHPGAVFSGTFYVTTPEHCSAIRFEDPRREKFANTPPKRRECRPANQRVIPYAAEAGKLILFESWLRHGVEPNPTVEERISVSFNYAWV